MSLYITTTKTGTVVANKWQINERIRTEELNSYVLGQSTIPQEFKNALTQATSLTKSMLFEFYEGGGCIPVHGRFLICPLNSIQMHPKFLEEIEASFVEIMTYSKAQRLWKVQFSEEYNSTAKNTKIIFTAEKWVNSYGRIPIGTALDNALEVYVGQKHKEDLLNLGMTEPLKYSISARTLMEVALNDYREESVEGS